MTDEQFQAMLDIHVVVPFRMVRAVAPHMRDPAKEERDRGDEVFRKIINITSVSGTMGNAGQVNYSSGKAAVTGLTKTLAKEWGQFKINVNAVAFGFVETRLTQANRSTGRGPYRQQLARRASGFSPRPQRHICRGCGTDTGVGQSWCNDCRPAIKLQAGRRGLHRAGVGGTGRMPARPRTCPGGYEHD